MQCLEYALGTGLLSEVLVGRACYIFSEPIVIDISFTFVNFISRDGYKGELGKCDNECLYTKGNSHHVAGFGAPHLLGQVGDRDVHLPHSLFGTLAC